uniref:Uncharacterized protein n=1 Tax=Arundo donax TaxID=35708 RepID=A0A0A9C697_ARUDO
MALSAGRLPPPCCGSCSLIAVPRARD